MDTDRLSAIEAACSRIEAKLEALIERRYGLLKADKRASQALAVQFYPLAAHMLRRVQDHNRAEAILLARYGLEVIA